MVAEAVFSSQQKFRRVLIDFSIECLEDYDYDNAGQSDQSNLLQLQQSKARHVILNAWDSSTQKI